MKFKNIVLGMTLLVSCVAFAQEKGDTSGFLALSYPLYTGANAGATAGFEYMVTDEIGGVASFTYFFAPTGITHTEISVDARYYVGGTDSLKYYGIGGVSFQTIKAGVSVKDTGFNAGGGLIWSMSESMGLIAQVKYGTAGTGGVEPMVGFSFNF